MSGQTSVAVGGPPLVRPAVLAQVADAVPEANTDLVVDNSDPAAPFVITGRFD